MKLPTFLRFKTKIVAPIEININPEIPPIARGQGNVAFLDGVGVVVIVIVLLEMVAVTT